MHHSSSSQNEGRFRQPVFIGLATPADVEAIDRLRDQALRGVDYARFQKDPAVLRVSNDPKGLTHVCKAWLADGTLVATGRFGLCFTQEELINHLCAEYEVTSEDLPILASGRAAALQRVDGNPAPTPGYGGHRALRHAMLEVALRIRLPDGRRIKSQMGANAVGGVGGRPLNPLPNYLRKLGYVVEEATQGSFIYEGPQCTNRADYNDLLRIVALQGQQVRNGTIASWTWVGDVPFKQYLPPCWTPSSAPAADPARKEPR